MSSDPTDHFVPKKRNYKQGEPDFVDITTEDITAKILVREGGVTGPVDVVRGMAYGQPYEYRTNESGAWWVDYTDKQEDGQPHWSNFMGERILVDVTIESWNQRRVHEWKGYDEIKASCVAKVFFNRIPVWEVSGREPRWVLARVQEDIRKLMDCDALTEFVIGKEDALIGRKIFYREQPGIITRFIEEQGCIMIQADPGPWLPAPWQISSDIGLEDYDMSEEIKDQILSPHIWWHRDEDHVLKLSSGFTATFARKGVWTLKNADGMLVGDNGVPTEFTSVTAMREVIRDQFTHGEI